VNDGGEVLSTDGRGIRLYIFAITKRANPYGFFARAFGTLRPALQNTCVI
jgi:hypothetical protein